MLFRKKQVELAVMMDESAARYLPELRAYAAERYGKKELPKTEEKPKIKYSLAEDSGIRYSRAYTPDDTMPYSPTDLKRDLALWDSPAMKNYYHSWEKKKSVAKSFSSEVLRMVKARYMKMSEFYIPAGIDRRIFHKIRTDYLYKPSRETAMKCCLGLHLSVEAAKELLGLAGYSFSLSDPKDLVVLFCLEKKIWDVASVNYLMESFDLKDLDGYEPA